MEDKEVINGLSDDNPTGTLLLSMNNAGYVYVKIKGKDSWCNDAIQYTITAQLIQVTEIQTKMVLLIQKMTVTQFQVPLFMIVKAA